MNTKQKIFNLLKENKKRELSKKVNLSVIQNIITEFEPFEEAESDTSYFAYDYVDEAIDAYEQWRNKYPIDNYVVNGAMRNLPETTDALRDNLAELESAADNLGISPQEILDNAATGIDYDDLKVRLANADDLFNDAKNKMREISDYTGIPDFLN
tara:strand:+ start:391 stop:855 length:465 start_codon:yes stop_codon:yes gene_type:complete